MKKTIILFENHSLYLENLQQYLSTHLSKSTIFHAFSNFQELEQHSFEKKSLLFFNISCFNTFETYTHIENLLEQTPSLQIILHTNSTDAKMIKKSFDKGIKSFLGSETTTEELLTAVKTVLSGKIYVSKDAKNALFNFMCNVEDEEKTNLQNVPEVLTAREKDVLDLICQGLRSREMAERLFISTHTVESHRRNIMLKLNINNSSQLVKYALEHNMVDS